MLSTSLVSYCHCVHSIILGFIYRWLKNLEYKLDMHKSQVPSLGTSLFPSTRVTASKREKKYWSGTPLFIHIYLCPHFLDPQDLVCILYRKRLLLNNAVLVASASAISTSFGKNKKTKKPSKLMFIFLIS